MLRRPAAQRGGYGGDARLRREYYPAAKIGVRGRFGGGMGGGAGSAAGPTSAMMAGVVLTIGMMLLVIAAITGFTLTTVFWKQNVDRLDERLDLKSELITNLTADVQFINDTMPAGDGITFYDNIWRMVNGLDNTKVMIFNASLISPSTSQNYAFPDASGTVLLEETMPPPQTEFAENEFALFGWPDPSMRATFSLELFVSGEAFTYLLPAKNGTLATLGDVVGGPGIGNQTIFVDDQFSIVNVADNTKEVMFDVSGVSISTTRVLEIPDLDGEITLTTGAQNISDKTIDASNTVVAGALPSDVVYETGTQTISDKTLDASNTVVAGALPSDVVYETGAQTLSDKTIDNSNAITVPDGSLTIEGGTGTFQFDGSLLTAPRQYTGPDKDGVLLMQGDAVFVDGSGAWDLESMQLVTSPTTLYQSVDLEAPVSNSSTMFKFHSGTQGTYSRAGLTFNEEGGFVEAHVYTDNDRLVFSTTIDPIVGGDLGDRVMSVGLDGVGIYSGDGFRGVIRGDLITATRDLFLPDESGTFALQSDIQALLGNVSVFFDDAFAVRNAADNSKEMMFDVSIVDTSTTRTYIVPNENGPLMSGQQFNSIYLEAAPLQNQSVPDDTWTKITFNTSGNTFLEDISSSWNVAEQRFDVPRDGWYSASFTVSLSDSEGNGTDSVEVAIVVASGAGDDRVFPGSMVVSAPGVQRAHVSIPTVRILNGGWIAAYVRHVSGAPRLVLPSESTTFDGRDAFVRETFLQIGPVYTPVPATF